MVNYTVPVTEFYASGSSYAVFFFLKSAQRESTPKARKRRASSQFSFFIASIKAIPKKIMNTAMFVNPGFVILFKIFFSPPFGKCNNKTPYKVTGLLALSQSPPPSYSTSSTSSTSSTLFYPLPFRHFNYDYSSIEKLLQNLDKFTPGF
jgi:hypothetical protein